MDKQLMRCVFLGNHTLGVRVLATLCEQDCAPELVVAHPPDPEDGVCYASVFDWAQQRGLPTMRSRPGAELTEGLRSVAPELLVVADYRYLLPRWDWESAGVGAVNFHPSLLPAYRGRAPLNWAILDGQTRLGLTVHRLSDGVDDGEIIMQESFELAPSENVGHALQKLTPLYEELTRRLTAMARGGELRGTPQPAGHWPIYPARKPDDGAIHWGRPATHIVDLIRAVARPYPGAFCDTADGRLTIWEARALGCRPLGVLPGTVTRCEETGFRVACGTGELWVRQWEGPRPTRVGASLHSAGLVPSRNR